MQKTDKAWYKEWFNTSYYHKLYQHRDENEARQFIDNITAKLKPADHWHFLDLACGRGRHAVYLHEKGYAVTGIDLSPRNIEFAKQFEEENLRFETADMRHPFGEEKYHCILNLFTSFGYFDSLDDSQRACLQIKKALKPGATLVMDFMNVQKVILGLVEQEVREVEGITFRIERSVRDGKVVKTIRFEDRGEDFAFEEKVQLLELADFKRLFGQAGLELVELYGDYELNAFDKKHSERLILIARA